MTSNYILNIDWLSLYGYHALPLNEEHASKDAYRSPSADNPDPCCSKDDRLTEVDATRATGAIKRKHIGALELEVKPYGTRQFSTLIDIYHDNELFAQLQVFPRTSVLPRNAFILKIANAWLYRANWPLRLDMTLRTLNLRPKSISRLDLAADFNVFADGTHPIDFIAQFMRGEIKHKGRGAGHVDFVQRYAYLQRSGKLIDTLNFNALTIGKKTSDAHFYLYNKSLELEQVKLKPYIVDCWDKAGFDIHSVWRLEVTMSSKALRFTDRVTGELVQFTLDNILHPTDRWNIATLYHVMLRSLFFFFRPTGQHNVSREKMLNLFGEEVAIERGVLHDTNPSTRTERILIKQLYTLAKRYKGVTMDDAFAAETTAIHLADSCRLLQWMDEKKSSWANTKFRT